MPHILVSTEGIRKDLVERLSEQENLVAASFEFLNEDAAFDLLGGLSSVGNVEYLSLPFPFVLRVLGIVRIIINPLI